MCRSHRHSATTHYSSKAIRLCMFRSSPSRGKFEIRKFWVTKVVISLILWLELFVLWLTIQSDECLYKLIKKPLHIISSAHTTCDVTNTVSRHTMLLERNTLACAQFLNDLNSRVQRPVITPRGPIPVTWTVIFTIKLPELYYHQYLMFGLIARL